MHIRLTDSLISNKCFFCKIQRCVFKKKRFQLFIMLLFISLGKSKKTSTNLWLYEMLAYSCDDVIEIWAVYCSFRPAEWIPPFMFDKHSIYYFTCILDNSILDLLLVQTKTLVFNLSFCEP